MNQEKIGKFILELRLNNNLTQLQLADKLGVTSQAVSKWENGRGVPDIEILKLLGKEFNVSINELVNGEKDTVKKSSNKNLLYFISILCLFIFVILIYNVFKENGDDYKFNTIQSINENFSVTGVAAYSKERKSIYIDKIDYVNEKDDDVYIDVTCSLYELHDNMEERLSESFSSSDFPKSLKELLNGVIFNVDGYGSDCKELTTNSLYIVINAKNSDDKVINYKIPLTLSCTNEELLDE